LSFSGGRMSSLRCRSRSVRTNEGVFIPDRQQLLHTRRLTFRHVESILCLAHLKTSKMKPCRARPTAT
jgi:hypothetical protein